MPERDLQPIREIIRRHALLNAIRFGGKANPQAVAGKAFSEDPTLRTMAPEVFHLADQVVAEVNSMGAGEQKSAAESLGLSTIREKIAQPERLLPPLPHVEKYPVVHVRFAPNPDSVIHLGNTRAAILSDEYAKMYKGLFTLRFEDTSPSIKPPIPEAYEIIRQDLSWLRIHWEPGSKRFER